MSLSSSPALTCNRICWPLSSSNLHASRTKQSVLVLSHPENDHAALIREAFQERPSHHWQHNSIHLSIKLSLLRLSASGLGLGEEDRLELFIEGARLLDLLSRGHCQRERHDIQVFDAVDEICARVSLKHSSAMIKGRSAHLIFGVFVDLKHLGRQLVRFEAFAVKCKQTDVIEHTAPAMSSF